MPLPPSSPPISISTLQNQAVVNLQPITIIATVSRQLNAGESIRLFNNNQAVGNIQQDLSVTTFTWDDTPVVPIGPTGITYRVEVFDQNSILATASFDVTVNNDVRCAICGIYATVMQSDYNNTLANFLYTPTSGDRTTTTHSVVENITSLPFTSSTYPIPPSGTLWFSITLPNQTAIGLDSFKSTESISTLLAVFNSQGSPVAGFNDGGVFPAPSSGIYTLEADTQYYILLTQYPLKVADNFSILPAASMNLVGSYVLNVVDTLMYQQTPRLGSFPADTPAVVQVEVDRDLSVDSTLHITRSGVFMGNALVTADSKIYEFTDTTPLGPENEYIAQVVANGYAGPASASYLVLNSTLLALEDDFLVLMENDDDIALES